MILAIYAWIVHGFRHIHVAARFQKAPWLAFIGNNRLKLNDSINSLWLDLIDAENIPAHIS